MCVTCHLMAHLQPRGGEQLSVLPSTAVAITTSIVARNIWHWSSKERPSHIYQTLHRRALRFEAFSVSTSSRKCNINRFCHQGHPHDLPGRAIDERGPLKQSGSSRLHT
jgi:hypothetical protein